MIRAGAAGALGVAVASALLGAAAGAQSASPRAACVRATIAVLDTLDSAHARAGDSFTFAVVEPVTAPDGTALATGTVGYGIVSNASHADRGGRGGYLALETHFAVAPNDKHVPVIIDRQSDSGSASTGASGNAPGLLGWIPIVGYAVGGYDSLHHGKDAAILRGTRIAVFVGDDAARGACRTAPDAAATPSPPAASPGPSPAP